MQEVCLAHFHFAKLCCHNTKETSRFNAATRILWIFQLPLMSIIPEQMQGNICRFGVFVCVCVWVGVIEQQEATNELRPGGQMWTLVCLLGTAVLFNVRCLFLWNESQWLVKYKLRIQSWIHQNTEDFGRPEWIVFMLNVSTSSKELLHGLLLLLLPLLLLLLL